MSTKSTPTLAPETALALSVNGPVCGVDEAGRGPLAGPVVAGAVILDPDNIPAGIGDSKALTERRREALEPLIQQAALAWGVGFASAQEIDQINILKATELAMQRAVTALAITPAAALVDGNYRFALPCPVTTLIKGDSLSLSIAAASILAKVARDRHMTALDAQYPGYGFARHKGYGAAAHMQAIRTLGPCPEHRTSWAPFRNLTLDV